MAPPASVQIFGRKDSRSTQAALRFFRERRVQVSMVDIATRAPAPTELRRFAQRLGPRALLDVESKAYRDQGLGYLSMDDEEVLERLFADPRLLRLPLVRAGDRFSAGPDEATWKAWLQA
jgi:arsenate reductase-like glutaredoxin family protein